MAVRVLDLTETEAPVLTVLQTAPRRRQDLRRLKQRWELVGACALALPFALTLVAVAVVR